jgi:hypothetical protein
MVTASATTGVLGQRLVAGFDTADFFVDRGMGKRIQVWDREVSLIRNPFGKRNSDKPITLANLRDLTERFSVLALRVIEEGIPEDTEVEVLSCGSIREIRAKFPGKRMVNRFRSKGSTYYGSDKAPVFDEDEDDDV